MKKVILTLVGVSLCVLLVLGFSEYRTKNFVDTFISNPDEFAEAVDSVVIWANNDTSTTSEVIVNQVDVQFNEIQSAFSEWEMKRTIFKELDLNRQTYGVNFTNAENPMNSFNILIDEDGMINVNGYEYELVSGSSIEELIERVK
ncbi:hypothetical protein [Lysinibacillus halotolerans]|uniref:Uncharacterized protein n=1 Tax=Lysinibacillus halotolerans TaxID=1368476 RepID=A0A3M8HFG2_9BACI|nr:hypothetical protein [Lysinibacillus halotolerans]RND01208.1 hypothetical protein EC501_02860 [Lysinibacillus halotolerans]